MNKIEFQDYPSTETPLNAENLNQMQTNIETAINGIVESGSNENGDWTKWADGTMICKGSRVFSNIVTEKTWGALYETVEEIDFGSYPASFIETPKVTITFIEGTTVYAERFTNRSNTNIGKTYFWRPVSGTAGYATFDFIAIGKWK